jgi:hypothetical protein
MRAEALAELCAIMRGVPGGTHGTAGTTRVLTSSPPGTSGHVPVRKRPLFQVFQAFQVEHDEFAEAERAGIAVVDGRVPHAYADAWAVFQIRKPDHQTEAEWFRAIDDAGRFLDEWAALALDFGWQANDIFSCDGLAWFLASEPVRALGPDSAMTRSTRIFTRRSGRP